MSHLHIWTSYIKALESYRLTDRHRYRQRDRHNQNYIPRRFAGAQLISIQSTILLLVGFKNVLLLKYSYQYTPYVTGCDHVFQVLWRAVQIPFRVLEERVAALLNTRCVMDMIIAVITAMKIYSSASRTVSQMVFHSEPSIGIPQSATFLWPWSLIAYHNLENLVSSWRDYHGLARYSARVY